MTNTLQDMVVPCREDCNGTATVVRKYWRGEEVPPVVAECARGCAHIILQEDQVAEAIEFYRIEVPAEEADDSDRMQAVAELHERLSHKRTDGDVVRYYSAPRKQRKRSA